jgi:alpha-tubulin suppressor-like RCC1 family protein
MTITICAARGWRLPHGLWALLMGLLLALGGCFHDDDAAGTPAPTITTQPQSPAPVPDGGSATFRVAADGANLRIQWQRNGVDVAGATGAQYTLSPATYADNGSRWRAVVSNEGGSTTSAEVTLTVQPVAAAISAPPVAITVNDGASATFSVAATGSAPLTYQWQRNGADVAGATAASYTLPAAALADSGAGFAVRVSGPGGSVTSSAALLTVVAVAPAITTQPTAQAVTAGQGAGFSVVARGSAPLAYQWRRNGADVVGATAASYSLASTTVADNGAVFSVRVSNAAGSVDSVGASLTVAVAPPPPQITAQPQPASVQAGQPATFAVVATGGAALTYQWQRNGNVINGATSASHTTPATTLADSGALYAVVVSDGQGRSVTSNAVALTVSAPPPQAARLSLAATHTVARRADGSVMAWGDNSRGQLGSGAVLPGTFARTLGGGAVALSAAELGGALRRADGSVAGWGTNEGGWLGGTNAGAATVYGAPVAVAWPRAVLDVAAAVDNFDAQDFLFAVLDDGTVWHLPGTVSQSGSATSYAPVPVPTLSGFTGLSTGHGPVRALRGDGTVWEFTLFRDLTTGAYSATAAAVPGLDAVTAVACGVRHCLALRSDGTLRAWGEGRSGELGHGVAASSSTPVVVSGLANVTHIAVTSVFGASFARTADGRLWSWGRGEMSARPANGVVPPPNVSVPTEVTSLAGALEVACSDRHCAVRLGDGSVWSWGDDLYQQMGNGPSTIAVRRQTPVRATGIDLN